MRRTILVMGVLLLPFLLSSCSDKPEQNVPRTRGVSEACDDTKNLCVAGLYCDNGKCREMCNENVPCGSNEKCVDNRCLPWSNPGSNTDEPGSNTDNPGSNTDEPGSNTDLPGTQSLGDNCDAQNKCASGLSCLGGTCHQNCQDSAECQTGEECRNSMCQLPQIAGETNKVALPAGGGLTNMSGKASDGRYKVQILGGSIAGRSKDNNKSVQLNDGAWK